MLLASLNLGQPEALPDPFAREGRPAEFTTAIRKRPATGPIRLRHLGLEGDAVADTKDHGGPDQAVLAYAGSHYPAWVLELGPHEGLVPGGFGENLTVAGTDETSVCLGDTWALGGARLEVSLPRIPCETLARRFQVRDMVKRVAQSGRTGWYLRVLAEGPVAMGAPVEILARPHPGWTVAAAFRLMLDAHAPAERRRALAECPVLPAHWRERLRGGT
jgi:MOSC domain-containing protein YiiM